MAASAKSPGFYTGTIIDTPGTGQLNITTSGTIFFSGTTFGAHVNVSAGKVIFSSGELNEFAPLSITATDTIAFSGTTFDAPVDISGGDTITFSSGTLNELAQLSIPTTRKIAFSGTIFDAPVDMSAGDFNFGASTFNATSTITKTGTTAVIADGGCTFNGITTITNSVTGDLHVSAWDSDIFNDDVIFISSAGSILIATGNDGATFNGNVYVESSSSDIEIGDALGTAFSTLASGKVIAVDGP